MALRNLTHWDDPLFRKKSRAVEKFDTRLWALLDDMRETLQAAAMAARRCMWAFCGGWWW